MLIPYSTYLTSWEPLGWRGTVVVVIHRQGNQYIWRLLSTLILIFAGSKLRYSLIATVVLTKAHFPETPSYLFCRSTVNTPIHIPRKSKSTITFLNGIFCLIQLNTTRTLKLWKTSIKILIISEYWFFMYD